MHHGALAANRELFALRDQTTHELHADPKHARAVLIWIIVGMPTATLLCIGVLLTGAFASLAINAAGAAASLSQVGNQAVVAGSRSSSRSQPRWRS
jgi:hypothetical protein